MPNPQGSSYAHDRRKIADAIEANTQIHTWTDKSGVVHPMGAKWVSTEETKLAEKLAIAIACAKSVIILNQQWLEHARQMLEDAYVGDNMDLAPDTEEFFAEAKRYNNLAKQRLIDLEK